MKEYKSYIKNKKIALVGPAQSIENSGNGEKIDSCDLVVRLNYARIKNEKDSGKKTNIIYYDGSFHNHTNRDIDFLVCSYPKTEWFFNSRCRANVDHYKKIYNHRVIPSVLYDDLKHRLDVGHKIRPNTGLVALVDLLQHDIESLFVTGVDFYRTGYLSTHPDYGNKSVSEIKKEFKKGDNGDYHDTEVQYKYFLENVYTDKRVIVDSYLKSIIEWRS